MKQDTPNVYQNLLVQAEKLRRHNRKGSYKTRERYYEALLRLLFFIAKKYRVQNIANIHPKHLQAYVQQMQDSHLAPATIKTDISGIRFWHDEISNPRYTLPDNTALDLERRKFGGVDRTWTSDELNEMLQACEKAGHDDYAACILLARHAGLRIHEALRLDTATAERSLRSGKLSVIGKGGRPRFVPVDPIVAEQLASFLAKTPRSHKLFVPEGKPTHIAKAELQNFIFKHRPAIEEGEASLTIHGLRHTYAAEQYKRARENGLSKEEAKRHVSELLGHNRGDITAIYLVGAEKEERKAQHNQNEYYYQEDYHYYV